ncbi:hypothetical protein Ae201684P_015047 [Aphanomyces euteiches]|nr:hypothetical protein Ae201684P_015047 [Aphanomyces euteiches]
MMGVHELMTVQTEHCSVSSFMPYLIRNVSSSETKLWQGYPKTCSLQKAWTHSAFCALEILAPSSMLPHFTMLTMWLYDVGFRKLIDLEALNCQL